MYQHDALLTPYLRVITCARTLASFNNKIVYKSLPSLRQHTRTHNRAASLRLTAKPSGTNTRVSYSVRAR